ncbi:hypothetical protein NOR_03950 [Metarhizium rileyi]|uniref:Uncharacterized protein n=1 Tax=Metarhizium rileyi (strain RCEF 4871) TaxID=1649241 RepID=A0A167EP16_METRR|nr:hypothetical protein NOR_03950 [Metarhizium rileyi RCEF 4871]
MSTPAEKPYPEPQRGVDSRSMTPLALDFGWNKSRPTVGPCTTASGFGRFVKTIPSTGGYPPTGHIVIAGTGPFLDE